LCAGQTKRRARAGCVWWEHCFVELFGYFSAIGKVTKKKIKQIDILSKTKNIKKETFLAEMLQFDLSHCKRCTQHDKSLIINFTGASRASAPLKSVISLIQPLSLSTYDSFKTRST